MASPAKELMDLFNSLGKEYREKGNYDKAFVFDSAESAVNNAMHGRSIQDILPTVRRILTENSEADFNSPAEKEAYLESVEWLDEFGQQYV